MRTLVFLFAILVFYPAFAEEAAPAVPALNSGDTAWMMVSSAFVLLMTLPGLALFYSGMVQKKNVLATLMQSLFTCCIVSVLWVVAGYSLVFTDGGAWLGNSSRVMLSGLELGSMSGTIPESVFIFFQMTFAIITPALIYGAVADRMHFSGFAIFTALWLMVVYVPVAHWVWGPAGFLGGVGLSDYKGLLGYGVMVDFAGGLVVHVNAGMAGLVMAIMLGKRKGFGTQAFLPHNLILSVVGAGLLWVGWFGFNAGSALAAGERAGMAMLVTHVASAAGAIAWLLAEWIEHKRTSILGGISGAVAGLVAITPASGFVDVNGALWIGLLAGVVCYFAASKLKNHFKYDDSLDVFGIHGVGGILGSVLTGVFAKTAIGGVSGALEGNTDLLIAQLLGTGVVVLYSGVATYVLVLIVKRIAPLRVDAETESNGLDLELHGERVP